jgi:hypothetical protein
MDPRKASDILYKRLAERYRGVFFTDAIVYSGQEFVVIYVDDINRSGLRQLQEFKGVRVLVRSISVMLEPVENLQK